MSASLMTLDDCAKRMGLPRQTFRDHVRPTLPVVAVGRRRMVRPEDLERWIQEHVVVGGVQGA